MQVKTKKPRPTKKSQDKWALFFQVGAAVAALGLLLIYLFVSREKLIGATFLHLLQIFFTLLALISAFGIAYKAMKARAKEKSDSSHDLGKSLREK